MWMELIGQDFGLQSRWCFQIFVIFNNMDSSWFKCDFVEQLFITFVSKSNVHTFLFEVVESVVTPTNYPNLSTATWGLLTIGP